ncbi:MAG: hypothetical protein QOH21_1705 [Acidobacteriota bacterium]|nr:hypothetical protein [Acidobacteriota bacterium]
MAGATSALYEPLIERELDALPAAVRAFRAEHSTHDLWVAVTRFALLAYSPSEHGRHALLCCLAAHDVGPTDELLLACARYAAQARQPWSEPPILEPPAIDDAQRGDLDELRAAVREGDRLRGERWLAARVADADDDLLTVAREHGDALLVVRAAIRLVPLLGEQGRYATLRVAVWDLIAKRDEPPLPERELEELMVWCVVNRGSVESVTALLVAAPEPEGELTAPPAYDLARDYGHLLLAHAARLPKRVLVVAADNLEHGDSFADWMNA